MRGYHNQPQKTAETIIEGWIRTGDLAQIDNEGFVKIIGRKKELFKTANGKYVSPVPIEQKLMQELGFLSGVVIVAEGKKFVSALLFPEFDLLKNFKAKLNCQERNNEEFLQSTNLQTFIEAGIAKVNAGLDHAEKVQKFAIISTPISTQNGEITPSMKLKRNVIEEKFKNVIEGFYKD
jgi:long-chain acyl-CoA synthetase